jgi:hypothetical protein
MRSKMYGDEEGFEEIGWDGEEDGAEAVQAQLGKRAGVLAGLQARARHHGWGKGKLRAEGSPDERGEEGGQPGRRGSEAGTGLEPGAILSGQISSLDEALQL